MTTTTTKLVSVERAIDIMECYGSNPDKWPEDERAAALALVSGSDSLQNKLNQARELDDLLETNSLQDQGNATVDSRLVMRIIDNLPEQRAGSHISENQRWNQWSSFGAGALAASLLIAVVTFFTVNSHSFSPSGISSNGANVAQYQELDQWFWEDVTVDVAQVDDEQQPVSFMLMLDLES